MASLASLKFSQYFQISVLYGHEILLPRKSTSVGGSAMLAKGVSSTSCRLLFWDSAAAADEEEEEVVIVFLSLLRLLVDAV